MAHPRIQAGEEVVAAAGPAVMVVLVCRSVGGVGWVGTVIPWDVNLGVWSGEVEGEGVGGRVRSLVVVIVR